MITKDSMPWYTQIWVLTRALVSRYWLKLILVRSRYCRMLSSVLVSRLCVCVWACSLHACVRTCVSAIVCACACVCVRVVQRLSSFLNNRQIASKCCPRPCRFHQNNDSVIQAMRTFQTFTPKFQPEIMVDSCDESFEMSAWLGQCYHHFDEISLLF
jgi:hypothetical protein